jgi:hypothetical protein
MASSPQKNLQFISPPKEAGDFLQNQVKNAIFHRKFVIVPAAARVSTAAVMILPIAFSIANTSLHEYQNTQEII